MRLEPTEPPAPPVASEIRARVDDRGPVAPPDAARRTSIDGQAPAEIPTLLPPRPPAQLLSQRAFAAQPTSLASRATAAVEETTEVHVSIGRIELTAVHETPPKRREPARTRKPRSLEEYLAARQERPR